MAEETGKLQEQKMKELNRLFDIINTEDFITEVEKQPAIWDSRTEEYINKTEKQNSWCSILKKFIPGFELTPAAEQNILVSIAQRRWKSIRSSYSRELLKRKSSGANNKRKQYVYFKQLRFLETLPKKAAGSMDEDDTPESINEIEAVVETHSVEEIHPVQEIDPDPNESEIPRSKKRKRGNNEDDELIEMLKKRIASETDSAEEDRDEDRLFLLSLLSEIKKVSKAKKLKLRADIITLIAAAQLPENQQVSPHFCMPYPLYPFFHPCTSNPPPPIHPSSSCPSSSCPKLSNPSFSNPSCSNPSCSNPSSSNPSFSNLSSSNPNPSHHQDPFHPSTRLQNPHQINTSLSSNEHSNSSDDLEN